MDCKTSTTPQAKRDFQNGHLHRYAIERTPMEPTWQVWLGNDGGWLVSQRDNTTPRKFKTLDAAVSAVEEIGFRITSLTGE